MDKDRNRAYLIVPLTLLLMLIMFFTPLNFSDSSAKAEEVVENSLVLHFIDVGQGDSTFIEFPNGKTMLIDGGVRTFGKDVVKYIKSLGYSKIDCVVATHSDSDHVGGLVEVLREFEVHYIFRPFVLAGNANPKDDLSTMGLTSMQILTDNNDDYTAFVEACYNESYDGSLSVVSTLSNKTFCDVFVGVEEYLYMTEVIYPYSEGNSEGFSTASGRTSGYMVDLPSDTNALSAIIYIATENNKILLMSDIDESVESDLLNLAGENVVLYDKLSSIDVLKVAHHGSKTSNSEKFLKFASPDIAVISVGERNEYGHPHDEVIERLSGVSSNILRTDKDGTIKLSICKSGNIVIDKNINTKSNSIIPEWILYLVFALIIVAIIVVSIVYTCYNKRKDESNKS